MYHVFAFSISTSVGITIDEYRRVEVLRVYHKTPKWWQFSKTMIMITTTHAHTFSHVTAYLELYLPTWCHTTTPQKLMACLPNQGQSWWWNPPENERRPGHCLHRFTRRSENKWERIVRIGTRNQNDKIGNPKTTPSLMTNQNDPK